MNKDSQRDAMHNAAQKFVEVVKKAHGLKRGCLLYWFYDEEAGESIFGDAGEMTYPESLGVAQHFVHRLSHDD